MSICNQWQHLSHDLNSWFVKICHHFGRLYEEDNSSSLDPELDFGPSYSLPTYCMSQALMHYWAARVLLYDILTQAVSWATEHNVPLPALDRLSGPIPISNFSVQDTSIAMASSSDLPGVLSLLQQNRDVATRNGLKCIRFTYAKEFVVINLTQSANAIYVVLQYIKKRRMAHEWIICAKAVAVFETRGLVLGDI